jgi:hypothetical protein
VNKTTGEFVQFSAGTGAVDNPGYQPPADPGYYAVTQVFANNPSYSPEEWTYEYRWWAVRTEGSDLVPDKPGEPLCKIAVALTPADVTAPTISGSQDVDVVSPSKTVSTYTADEDVTWSITGGANEDLFEIDPATGALTFKAASAPGTYTVIITATDDASNPTTMTITVTVGSASLATTGLDSATNAVTLSVAFVALLLGAFLMRRRQGRMTSV